MKSDGETAQLKFRVREDLRVALERAAQRNGRTLAGEIKERLQRTLREEDDAIARQIEDLRIRVARLEGPMQESLPAWEYLIT